MYLLTEQKFTLFIFLHALYKFLSSQFQDDTTDSNHYLCIWLSLQRQMYHQTVLSPFKSCVSVSGTSHKLKKLFYFIDSSWCGAASQHSIAMLQYSDHFKHDLPSYLIPSWFVSRQWITCCVSILNFTIVISIHFANWSKSFQTTLPHLTSFLDIFNEKLPILSLKKKKLVIWL